VGSISNVSNYLPRQQVLLGKDDVSAQVTGPFQRMPTYLYLSPNLHPVDLSLIYRSSAIL
jgi:hypothetical protein